VKPSEALASDSPSMVRRQAKRVPRRADGAQVDGERHVDRRASESRAGGDGEIPSHLDRLRPVGRLDHDRLAVGVSKTLPVMGDLGFMPVHVDLERNSRGTGSGPVIDQPPPRM